MMEMTMRLISALTGTLSLRAFDWDTLGYLVLDEG
jgi:hypothetical protein